MIKLESNQYAVNNGEASFNYTNEYKIRQFLKQYNKYFKQKVSI